MLFTVLVFLGFFFGSDSLSSLNYYFFTYIYIYISLHFFAAEVEQASDFLQKIGLSDLTKLYNQGKEITENVVNDSVRQKHLTARQAQTVKSRIRTLNKTLHNKQIKKKRQDIRDVAWNIEVCFNNLRVEIY